MVVLDSRGNVISDFSAGTVDLYDIDDTKDGYYLPVGSRQGVRREPDAVAWIDSDHFVTANEGDYKLKRRGEHKRGGSRGFTIFHKDVRLCMIRVIPSRILSQRQVTGTTNVLRRKV